MNQSGGLVAAVPLVAAAALVLGGGGLRPASAEATFLHEGRGLLPAPADPTFLSKQYARCTACHYSASGGGLLTPYGRSLSREEISTFGRQEPGGGSPGAATGEENFLFGVLSSESPLQLGLDIRPSHLEVHIPGRNIPDRNFIMNLDLQAAWRHDRWTAYGTIGREPTHGGSRPISYEHWLAYQVSDGISVRGGRFLPAYGVRVADHTSFMRESLDLAQDDQVYGVEVGVSTDRSLLQLSVGPGRAESLVDDDGRRALTAAGRWQLDLGSRMVFAASARYRAESRAVPRSTDTGLSFGYAPAAWLTTWTHADVRFQRLNASSRSYILANRTSVQAFRGLWLRVSPQWRWTETDPRGEARRTAFGLDFYPRTHWHVNLSYYRDHLQLTGVSMQTLLAQLHLYL